MQFLKNIKSSIYDPIYYKEMLNKPFSYSLRYFLSLMALASLAAALFFSISAVPGINKVISEIEPKVLTYYPDELEITVKNGVVSTNVPEPFFIKMPAELKGDVKEMKSGSAGSGPNFSKIDNLVAIDTASPLTIDLFNSYKTFVLIGHNSVAYYDNSAVKIQPMDQSADGVVTKAKVSSAWNEIMPYIKLVPYILVPIVFFGSFLGSIIGYLIYLIFGAAVIWLAAKAAKRELAYGKSYQAGLHAITLGVILDFTLFWFFPGLQVPFFFTFLMVVTVWVNLNFASNADSVPPAPTETPISSGKI